MADDMHIDNSDGITGSWLGFCFTAMTASASFVIQSMEATTARLEAVSTYATMVLPIIASLSGLMTIAYTVYKWQSERKNKRAKK